MQVFWVHGFAATSLDMLAEASGLNRPSIYATFGSKAEIYRQCVDMFETGLIRTAASELEGEGPLGVALRAWFTAMIDVYTGANAACGGRGCFIMTTAPVEAQKTADVAAVLEGVMARQRAAIEARLKRARSTGELGAGHDAAALAVVLAGVLNWLSISARLGHEKEELAMTVEAVLTDLDL